MDHHMINTNIHIYTSEKLRDITDLGWGELKDYVSPCLTSTEGICQMREGLAHSSFLDLHIHYYIRAESGDGKRMKIIWIGQMILNEWGINMQTLETQAVKNLIKDRYTIQPIDDIINNSFDGAIIPNNPMDHPLHVLTNQRAFFGAAGILDKGIVSAFADNVGHDLFILPSSRHEVLLCPDLGDVTTEELDGIVREINSSVVEPCDRLSDHVYYYDREMDEIRMSK